MKPKLLAMLSFLLLLTACASNYPTIYRHPETEERIFCLRYNLTEDHRKYEYNEASGEYREVSGKTQKDRFVENPDYNKCVEDARRKGFEDRTTDERIGESILLILF